MSVNGPFALLVHTIVSFLGNNFLAHMVLTSKRTKPVVITAWAVSWALVTLLSGLYLWVWHPGWNAGLPYYLFNLLYLATYAYLFEQRFSQRLFVFFMLWGFSSFLSAACKWSTQWSGAGSGSPWVWVGLYSIVFAVAVGLCRRFWRKAIRDSLAILAKGKPLYVAFPPMAFAVFVVLYGPLTQTPDVGGLLPMVLVEAMVLLTYYILFTQFRLIYERQQAENRVVNEERQRRLQKKHYEDVDRDVQTQARLLHDARHHFLALASLAKQEDAGEVDRYVGQLLKNFGMASRRCCEHSLTNAVVGSYLDVAEREGIAVTTALDLPADIGIDEYDLCTFFGNTVENAIEACQRIPETSPRYAGRYINVRSQCEDGRLVVLIENSYDGRSDQKPDLLSSSKGAAGGIGLESVALVVRSYRGTIDCVTEDSRFLLSAVLFPRPAPGESRSTGC